MFGEGTQLHHRGVSAQQALEPVEPIGIGSHRYDDRAGQATPAGLLAAKPSVLGRRTVTLLTLLGIAAIAYGTLAPFHFDLHRALNWNPAWLPPGPGDSVANILVYIPIGAFLRLLLRRRGSLWLSEALLALLTAGGISYLTEVAQSVIPARVSTRTDIVLNLAGAALGVCLAPTAQRWFRNLHAVLYAGLRTTPISMAAAAITLCLVAHALSPPDFYPSPRRVAQAWQRFTSPPDHACWLAGSDGAHAGAVHVVDKLMTGGAYGLLAFVLLLAAREAGRPLRASLWHALSRSVALAATVEAAQLFTISHVADPRDLTWAAVCCLTGAASAALIAAARPNLQHRPLAVMRGLVLAVAFSLLVWATASMRLTEPAPHAPRTYWLPMITNFHRSWNGLLGDYITGLMQYTLVASLLLLWYRAQRRAPWLPLIVTFTGTCAVVAGMVAAARQQPFDTAQVFLAVAAAIVAIRMDRAVFGKRVSAKTAPARA